MSDNNVPPSPLAPEVSPLLEADPNSINELISGSRIDAIFNKPSMLLTDEDLRITVEYYRRERLRFMSESAAKAAKGPAVSRAKPKNFAEALAASTDLL